MGARVRESVFRLIERDINFFSVTIDDLLSGDALIYIAEKEHRAKL